MLNYINILSVFSLIIISLLCFYFYYTRRKFKTEKYNLFLSILSLISAIYICITYYLYGLLETTPVWANAVVLSLIFCVTVSSVYFASEIFSLNSKEMEPIKKVVTRNTLIAYGLILLTVGLSLIIFIMGREWYMRYLYFPGVGIINTSFLIIIFTFSWVMKKQHKHRRLTISLFIGLIIILLGGTIEKALPVMNDNYILISFSVVLFFYVVLEQNNSNFFDLETLKDNLQEQVELKTTELRQTNQQLSLEKERKANLLINAAHEIKTPHTLIRNNIEQLALKHPELNEDIHFKGLFAEVNRVINDAVNILDEEKMNRKDLVYFHDKLFCLSSLLKDKVLLFEAFAGTKDIDIEGDIEDGLNIKASDDAINKVMNNLLENAIKYTQRGGKIRVSGKEKDGKIELVVKDNGVGIADADLPHIFERNYQISKKKEVSQGVGLGLFLVKQIVESLDGELNLTSLEGEGTSVQILLTPYRLQEGETLDEYALTRPVYNPDTSIEVKDSPMRKGLKTLLIVEDEPPLLKSLKERLEGDYNIMAAINGEAALKRLEERKPDLIISDIMMPRMDGIEFCKNVRANDELELLPFIFLTAKTTEKHRVAGLKLGAIDYISKPFNFEELELRLQNNFHLHETLKENSRLSTENDMLKNFEARIKNLTEAQKMVAKTIVMNPGVTNKKLGEIIGISPDTINTHIRNIGKALRIATNKDAVEEKLIEFLNIDELD